MHLWVQSDLPTYTVNSLYLCTLTTFTTVSVTTMCQNVLQTYDQSFTIERVTFFREKHAKCIIDFC